MDTRGSVKKYYKEIDKMDCLKRTGNQLVPVSCLRFGNSGKYCFVSQHKQYSKEYLSFIYICSNLACLFVGVHRHFVLYGLMEYLRKRWLRWNPSISTTMNIYGIWADHILYFAALTVNSLLMRFCNYWIVSLT